jgi:hypothetical protein
MNGKIHFTAGKNTLHRWQRYTSQMAKIYKANNGTVSYG